jgi:hypothetical protein
MEQMKTIESQSAFPLIESEQRAGETWYVDTWSSGGLTKREYFAVMALQGLLSNSKPVKDIVAVAVNAADELIIELNKPKVMPPPHDMLSK